MHINTITNQIKKDHRRRGRNECVEEFEGSSRYDRQFAGGATIALLADVDGNLGREELNNRIPHSNGFEPAQGQEGLITFAPSQCFLITK